MPLSVYASHDPAMIRAVGTPTINWGQPTQIMQHTTPTCESYFHQGQTPTQDFRLQTQPQIMMPMKTPLKNSRIAPQVRLHSFGLN